MVPLSRSRKSDENEAREVVLTKVTSHEQRTVSNYRQLSRLFRQFVHDSLFIVSGIHCQMN